MLGPGWRILLWSPLCTPPQSLSLSLDHCFPGKEARAWCPTKCGQCGPGHIFIALTVLSLLGAKMMPPGFLQDLKRQVALRQCAVVIPSLFHPPPCPDPGYTSPSGSPLLAMGYLIFLKCGDLDYGLVKEVCSSFIEVQVTSLALHFLIPHQTRLANSLPVPMPQHLMMAQVCH